MDSPFFIINPVKKTDMPSIPYRKLIRDRIPEIIIKSGLPKTRTLDGPEYRNAVGAKILEETHERIAE